MEEETCEKISRLEKAEKKQHRRGCLVTKAIYFAGMCIYMEFCFTLLIFHRLTVGMFFGFFSAAAMGLLMGGLANLGDMKVRKIVGWIFQIMTCVLFSVQFIYFQEFKTFLSYAIVVHGGGTEALGEFRSLVMDAILHNISGLLLLFLPLAGYGIYLYVEKYYRKGLFRGKAPNWTKVFFVSALVLYLLVLCLLPIFGTGSYTPFSLYHKEWIKDLSFEKLGFFTSTRLDMISIFVGPKTEEVSSDVVDMADLPGLKPEETDQSEKNKETESVSSENVASENVSSENQSTEESSPQESTEAPKPPETKYNKLDIDFASLAANEKNKDVKWLHEYMGNLTPTKQNEYTGMFKGYNLILITAESFSPWAVDEEITPTLYKLVNSGFVFENYYVPAFNNTSDGEYMVCTGLLPNGQGTGTFQSTVKNGRGTGGKHNMAMCFGNLLGKQGYVTKAYHNHTYNYYKRDLTHPNMGYEYKGYGSGLDVKKTWPESDLEMMQLTLDEYIDNEPFHAYYMSVSGHMSYTFIDNYMASKNRDYVRALPVSESMQAYIACQKELDLALEYVLKTLEEKGVLDHTVIALAADHYPYALEEELTEAVGDEADWYGVYHSNLILWSGSMEESIHVTKACSSIDIAPTLCNLLGIEYDSRLYTGRDILSDEPGLVIFSDQGFLTDYCVFNPATGKYKARTDTTVTDEYVNSVKEVVKQRWNAAGRMVKTDYYSYLIQLKN